METFDRNRHQNRHPKIKKGLYASVEALVVVALGIEPKSRASETLILSVVRRDRMGLQK